MERGIIMIITGSAVEMDSEHRYKSHESKRSVALIERASNAVQFKTGESEKSLYEQLSDHRTELEREQIEEQMQEYKKSLESAKNNKKQKCIKSKQELKAEIMHQFMDMIKRVMSGKGFCSPFSLDNYSGEDCVNQMQEIDNIVQQKVYDGDENEFTLPSGVWKKTIVNSYFYREKENVAYKSTGVVKCADGREFSFGITMEMSRKFCESYETVIQRNIIVADPLVINFEGNSPDISDMKFLFDLNNDGEEEEISTLGKGSGFLALDKNHDGKINNGSELFGTESGDGFADLSVYDEDGNGWIDEADSVFQDLVVWTKDENGEDKIVSLKDADVGAIYLGSASTEYTYRGDHYYEADAQLRSTGIFMKESGGVGTVSHVDFVV